MQRPPEAGKSLIVGGAEEECIKLRGRVTPNEVGEAGRVAKWYRALSAVLGILDFILSAWKLNPCC